MTRPLADIRNDLHAVRTEMDTQRLPDLVPLQLHVQHCTTQHALENSADTHENLRLAVAAVEQCKQAHARRAELSTRLRQLESEQSVAEAEEAARIRQNADRLLDDALNEVEALSIQLARAYRRAMVQAARNRHVKNAKSDGHIPHGLNIPWLNGRYNGGNDTSTIMWGGLLDFEVMEQQRAEAA